MLGETKQSQYNKSHNNIGISHVRLRKQIMGIQYSCSTETELQDMAFDYSVGKELSWELRNLCTQG